MPRYKRIPKTRERYTICEYCESKDLPCDNKIPCTFCKLANKTCKRNYRISDKTKALRKIFDAKINLLNTIEEAKTIFNALNIQHTFDKLYEVLDETQDTSEEESECHQDDHDIKDT
ncbi:7511_t:CDS:1 [Ambispora leptoticha]|uniref:7511_t:CDS:1 n=1 Tax=Ambispora leptoticha TaxID=144679 RepID=A0A9N9CDT1_9GLOM|nr:7511_t:CDS:1 [Ambispora leptoticha]